MGRHILAKSGYTDIAMEYKSIAEGLRDLKIVDKNLGDKLIQMAGYKSRLVHLYKLVSDDELYSILKEDLKDIENFVSAIKKYLANF